MTRTVIFLACLLPSIARADEDTSLQAQGHLVLSNDLGGGFSHAESGGVSQNALGLAPSLDWFLLRGLSVGARAAVGHAWWDGGSATWAAVGPRLGIAVAIAPALSFWPRLQVEYERLWVEDAPTSWLLVGDVDAPLVFEPVTHLFLGLGPYYARLLATSTSFEDASDMGVRISFGGWL